MTATRIAPYCTLSFIFSALAAFILFLPVQGRAQVSEATLTGTVTDPSGAVVPAATLSIRDVATGIVRQAVTNASGLYTAPNLLPGTYDVSVSATGFQTVLRRNVTLTVGALQKLNFSLKVGTSTQRVVVTGAPPAIQLASAEVRGVLSQDQVQQLPLNGRDWTSLATLQPGVQSLASEQSLLSGTDRARRGYGDQLAISGTRPTENSYYIDGVDVNDYANGGPGSVEGATLGVAAVQEFSVMTSNYSAEYGRTAGGIVNALTKSGTNSFHGSVYEYLRNSALDATNYFDSLDITTHVPLPTFKRNQFGADLGGPIRKDKTFFFVDYEGLRSVQGFTTQAFVPSAAVRGIGTGAGGGPGPSIVCSAGTMATTGCTPETLAQFVASEGQTVPNPDPVTGIDEAVMPYLGLWQLPNAGLVPGGNGDQGIYAFDSTTRVPENFGSLRIDQKFSNKDSVFGTYQQDAARQTLPDPNNDVLQEDNTGRTLLVVEETHIFSPDLLNSARFGFNRSLNEAHGVSAINPLASNTSLGEISGQDNPQIDVPSFTSIQPGLNQVQILDFYKNSFQGFDDLFWTHGKNSWKFGFAVENIRSRQYNPAPNGDYSFGSLYDPLNNGFLTNNPLIFTVPVPSVPFIPFIWHTTIYGAYAEDDISLKPNLTVNLGVRYEMSTVPYEINGHLISVPSPFGSSLADAQISHTLWTNPTYTNFEPRVGFAWDPFNTGKTSIRGGFGVFDVLPLDYLLGQFAPNAAPFVESTTLSTSSSFTICGPSNSGSCALAQGDFPFGGVAKAEQSATAGVALRVPYVEHNPGRDYVMQWNFGIQREILPNFTADVTYVGNHGVHGIFRADTIDTTFPTATSSAGVFFAGQTNGVANGTLISPLLGQMDTLQWIDSTLYNALEVQLNKRMSRGFEVGTSFTWGRAIDEGDGSIASDSFLNSIPDLFYFLPRYRRGPSDFNVKENLTVNYLWNIPTRFHNGFLGTMTGGWQLGGILTAQGGLPFTPLMANDPLGLASSSPFAFPSRLRGSGCGTPVNPGNVLNYVKLQCFSVPLAPATLPAGVTCIPFSNPPSPLTPAQTCSNLLGNGGRNEVYGPGILDLDSSFVKDTKLRENLTLEFQAQMFNIINHPNFKPPVDNSTFFNADGSVAANAGALDATSVDQREIQFSLSLMF